MSEVPESIESMIEHVRRSAAGLEAYHLDEALAIAVARRDVAAAYGRAQVASNWNEVAIAYDDVRRTRRQVAWEIEAMTQPQAFTRPLTAEELEEIEEPPC